MYAAEQYQATERRHSAPALLDPLSQVGASGQRLCPASQPTRGKRKNRHLREHEGLADFAEGNAFRSLMQRGLEALNRFAKIFGAEVESLMMDRHDEMSASFIGHVHGLFRSAVRMNPGIVLEHPRRRGKTVQQRSANAYDRASLKP
jgi:hypothetical protein